MSMPSISEQIISLCQNPNTALQAIHLLIANNGASESAFRAVYDRVMVDNDVDGAYYLANFAQKVDDLPFEVLPLVRLVMASNDELMKQALLDKMPDEARANLDTLLANDAQKDLNF
ncbi:hypothetical protein LP123_08730 [Moraxella bovis]|uniref:Uncharacterized protein n=2 Tax=Moraxella bovis TaxID=476 RepID=A0AAQ2T3T3_MORBO|nr:hypothetical protein [Moraxella bovis]AWY20571.1 hypothetical protein DQF64_08765 [Moraxella bovis]OOR88824.1 hypothetical protein B0182_08930 [Moraxella bovis]UYZ71841.1 hypothetical protein LP089_05295 [Moraxella bovis]UYZ76751.1 hypothetical protein LP093_05535 [Moraxella bovis]UYZ77297.1 hypothetical protein LP115_08285 [Moraxella bovis]